MRHIVSASTLSTFLLFAATSAIAGIVDQCKSTATSVGGTVIACPMGDGTTLAEAGATISITIHDGNDIPIQGIPASDFWLIGCNSGLFLCGGSASSAADAATDGLGQTTMSGTIAAGGDDSGVYVVVQGVIISGNPGCAQICLPINVRSVDLTSSLDLIADSNDEIQFGSAYTSPPNVYNAALDFNNDGVIDLTDLIILKRHTHVPGHSCF